MDAELWVIVFSKYPRAGEVNTRLCPPLSPEQAADVQRACLLHVLAQVASPRRRTIVCGAPDDDLPAFRELLGEDVELWPQGAGDLGDRLVRAAERAFAVGAPAIAFVGTDSPAMPWALFDDLPRQLASADAVIGPCADGGYYFIALAANHAELFAKIDWGGDQVAAQTRSRACSAGLTLGEAPIGYDIDRIEDLHWALADIKRTAPGSALANTLQHIVQTHG